MIRIKNFKTLRKISGCALNSKMEEMKINDKDVDVSLSVKGTKIIIRCTYR